MLRSGPAACRRGCQCTQMEPVLPCPSGSVDPRRSLAAAAARRRRTRRSPSRRRRQRKPRCNLSLDGRLEGPAALFLLPQDKGYFRNEDLDVTIDEATTPLEPITRVASGSLRYGLCRHQRAHPISRPEPDGAGQGRVHGLQQAAVLDHHPQEPRHRRAQASRRQEARRAAGRHDASSQWPLFAKLNDIDASKVTIEQIGIPVRAPMLAAGQLDAALGYSFRVYVDLKDRGVPVDDIVLLLMAELRPQALRQRHHREYQVRGRKAGSRQGFPATPS